MKGGLSSGAVLFLNKATQGNVSLDTAGMKSRKQISLITAPRLGFVFFFFSSSFSPSSHHFTTKLVQAALWGRLVSVYGSAPCYF